MGCFDLGISTEFSAADCCQVQLHPSGHQNEVFHLWTAMFTLHNLDLEGEDYNCLLEGLLKQDMRSEGWQSS